MHVNHSERPSQICEFSLLTKDNKNKASQHFQQIQSKYKQNKTPINSENADNISKNVTIHWTGVHFDKG